MSFVNGVKVLVKLVFKLTDVINTDNNDFIAGFTDYAAAFTCVKGEAVSHIGNIFFQFFDISDFHFFASQGMNSMAGTSE
jgi:hypothetical protein